MVIIYVLGAGAGGLLCFVVLWPAYGLIVALSYWPVVSALTALLGIVVSCALERSFRLPRRRALDLA
jgi:hypothetical protein